MIDAFGVGVHDVVRQRRLRDPIRLLARQFPAPELEADQRCQVEQVGVGDPLTDQTDRTAWSSRASLIARRISWSHSSGVRGRVRFIACLALRGALTTRLNRSLDYSGVFAPDAHCNHEALMAKPRKPKKPKRDETREERISMEIVVDAYNE